MSEFSWWNDLTVPPKGWLPFVVCWFKGHSCVDRGSFSMCRRCQWLGRAGEDNQPYLGQIILHRLRTALSALKARMQDG